LSDQIDSIATGTRYSGQSLLDGTSAFAAGASVLVGSTSADTITVKLDDLTSATLGVDTLDVSTQAGATAAIDALDTAIDTVSAARATIGAQESRFNFSASSISTQSQNLQAANSAITDVDIAAEQAKLSSSQVKVQAAVAAESSANQMPQYLLKLLG
jgi:flagellin